METIRFMKLNLNRIIHMFETLFMMVCGDYNTPHNKERPLSRTYTENADSVPYKFKADIESLEQKYGLTPGQRIVIPLSTALEVMPRKRKRLDAYTSLANWLKQNRNITLIVESNKGKKK